MTLSWLFHHTVLVLSFLHLCLQSTHFIPKFSFTHSYFLMPSFLSLQLETWPSRKNSWVVCKSSAIILSCPLPLRNMSCFVPKPTPLFLSQPLGPPLWFFSLSQFPPLVWLHFCLWHLFLSYWADIGSQNNSYEKFISLETVNSPPPPSHPPSPLNRSASKNSVWMSTYPFYLFAILPSAPCSLPFQGE